MTGGKRWLLAFALALLLCLMAGAAEAFEAQSLTDQLTIMTNRGQSVRAADGDYTTYWQSKDVKHPWMTITCSKPMYGLYLCFRMVPGSYALQVHDGINEKTGKPAWRTIQEGDTRFAHVYYMLPGETSIRIIATEQSVCSMGLNEVFAFGPGEPPSWVQRWQEPVEKADILFLVAHPDDELLFLGGAIPTYAVERKKSVVVAYLTWSNTTRRSEALNGLWSMGVRNYPDFGGFGDRYSTRLSDAYDQVTGQKRAVWMWITEMFRKYRPEVVVTHDPDGEYGHGQHQMMADAAINCYDLAADENQYRESAAQYGTWQVKKLYLHLWGNESNQIHMDWNVPLSSFDGKTGIQLAEEAYALHMTQQNMGIKIHGKFHHFSVAETGGELYPNTVFGLYASRVGPDETHTDFLEHIHTAAEDHAEAEKEEINEN